MAALGLLVMGWHQQSRSAELSWRGFESALRRGEDIFGRFCAAAAVARSCVGASLRARPPRYSHAPIRC